MKARKPARARSVPVVSPPRPMDVSDYTHLAPSHMSKMAWEYISGGAADELTLRWNHEAFSRLRLRLRNLVDVSHLDTRVTLFGRELPSPLLLAPVAYQQLLNPAGELATVRGAEKAGATIVLSTFSTVTLEHVAAAGKQPHWFQLYVQPDRAFTRDLIQRAEAAGFEALVITVDTPVLGARYREQRHKFVLPPGMVRANLKGLKTAVGSHRPTESDIYSATLNPALTWADLDWLRAQTKLPIILKGVMDADDAALAVAGGASGLIVSNHGGRNLDTVPATIDALPRIVDRVAGRVPLLLDGGIRRGTDILKALACGASAVLIGRPYLFGLAVAGEDGVGHVITLLRRELEMAMALTGKTTLKAVDRSIFWE